MACTTSNQSITPDARPVIEALSRFTARPEVLSVLRRAQADALKELQRDPKLAASVISVNPASPGLTAPDGIGSIRVAVTRHADGDAIERHANSIQYLFVLDGPVETHVKTESGWRVDRYGRGNAAVLEDRWHVVGPGVWHKTVAPGLSNWGIVAFHSAQEVLDEYQ